MQIKRIIILFFSSLLCRYYNFLINFYNFLIFIIFLFLIFQLIFLILYYNLFKKDFLRINLELLLTFSSFFIILFNFYPTLKIISFIDNNDKIIINKNLIIINIFGYQWFWNYFISNINNFNFDSNILNLNDLKYYKFFNNFSRNLDCNNHLILPLNLNLLFISLSDNVIHSWFIPELNLKLETNPGFINYFLRVFNKIGLFFGNCAEICGQGHSNIPILIEITNLNYFLNYYNFK